MDEFPTHRFNYKSFLPIIILLCLLLFPVWYYHNARQSAEFNQEMEQYIVDCHNLRRKSYITFSQVSRNEERANALARSPYKQGHRPDQYFVNVFNGSRIVNNKNGETYMVKAKLVSGHGLSGQTHAYFTVSPIIENGVPLLDNAWLRAHPEQADRIVAKRKAKHEPY